MKPDTRSGSGMFVTDYDGTLLTDDRTLNPIDMDSLARLRACGVITVIATGRSLFSFERSLSVIGRSLSDLPVDYLVFSTGAGIMDLAGNKRIIRALSLAQKQIGQTCAFFDAQGFDYMVHKPIPDTPYFLYRAHGRENSDFEARLSLYPSFGRPWDPSGRPVASATEVLAIIPPERLAFSREEIQGHLNGTSVIFATSPIDRHSIWVEVFHAQVSKSRAVAWLCVKEGLVRDQVVSVGNDYNDLDLLEWSGLGVLVANSPKDLDSRFVRVGSNNCCGVSQAARMAGWVT